MLGLMNPQLPDGPLRLAVSPIEGKAAHQILNHLFIPRVEHHLFVGELPLVFLECCHVSASFHMP